MKANNILVLNCGSSSIKFAVINCRTQQQLLEGLAEGLNGDAPRISWVLNQQSDATTLAKSDYETAIRKIVSILNIEKTLAASIMGVGHRVVHGGERFKNAVIINQEVINDIQQCIPLAPIHNPANLLGIKTAQKCFISVPHVAVFDTAFHQSMPDYAFVYPIPYKYYETLNVRRYGFHGTSHEYVTKEAAKRLNLNYNQASFISAHLGNGCSICAVKDGKSVDTSMGLTPLEGLTMGTRSGDVDPGLLPYLAEQLGLTLKEVTQILNKKSGLLGISELSMDMRELTKAAEQGNQKASLAIKVFCYRLAKYIASYTVPLGKIDALIFTGGIGENAKNIRDMVLSQLEILGFIIDPALNKENGKSKNGIITKNNSPIAIVINTDEQLAIAQQSYLLIQPR